MKAFAMAALFALSVSAVSFADEPVKNDNTTQTNTKDETVVKKEKKEKMEKPSTEQGAQGTQPEASH